MIFFGIIFGALVTFIVAVCYIITIYFTVWMAIDAGKQDRFWWLVLIIGIPIIGSGAYYFTEKKHEYMKAEVHHVHDSETEDQHEKSPKKRIRKAKQKIESIENAPEIKEEIVQSTLEEISPIAEVVEKIETKQE